MRIAAVIVCLVLVAVGIVTFTRYGDQAGEYRQHAGKTTAQESTSAGTRVAEEMVRGSVRQEGSTAGPEVQTIAGRLDSTPPPNEAVLVEPKVDVAPDPELDSPFIAGDAQRPSSDAQGEAVEASGDKALMPEPSVIPSFEEQRREVEAELAGETTRSREDLLAMYGRASAAAGHFDRAAAAYQIFLDEIGTEHAYSSRIAMRLADCLAPLDLDHVRVVHTDNGPVFKSRGRMGYTPKPAQLRQALSAYERAAELADNDARVGWSLLKLGWVHRALGDWTAATEAWTRCAVEAAGTKSAADALWLAAENLAWTRQPSAAAEQLRWFAEEYADSPRAAAAADRAECLEADARRGPEWLKDPVSSLKAEIAQRAAVRPAHEAYRSILQWLRAGRHSAAVIQVSRWACTQADWPLNARLACHYDLADALLADCAGSNDRLGPVP